jgi:sulfofructose kinase
MRIPFAVADPSTKQFDLVGLGQNSVDYVAEVATYPSADTKQRLQRFAVLPGGQVATAVAACARLGWRSRYVGAFGDDAGGRLARASLAAEGIDLTGSCTVSGAGNRVAIVLVDRHSGGRTILWHADPALRIGQIAGDVAASGRLLLVDADDIAASTAAVVAARTAAVPTLIDVDTVVPGIDSLLKEIDAIITAEEFPEALTGQPDLGRAMVIMAREYRAALICVTLGAKGSLALCGGIEIRTPGFPVVCVDSTGAGDVFRGAFASACLRWPDGDLAQALAYANAAAALSCGALGARGALPDARAVEAFLGL